LKENLAYEKEYKDRQFLFEKIKKSGMKKLIIVESPAKIKTIKKFLGPDFTIMATMGHVKDLPEKKIGVSLDDGVSIDYVVLEGKEKTIADICKTGSKSDEIYLAPDPDREGEIIAWHVEQELEKVIGKKTKIYRIAFNEITKSAIIEALDHPSTIDMDRVAAQQARRVLDRWVGYEVSPVLWRKLKSGLSAGRVQSVALRLICDREKEIRAFVKEEYWTVGIEVHTDESKSFIAQLTHVGTKKAEIKNEKEANAIVAQTKKESLVIDSVTDKKRSRSPYPPFMTSTLQQEAFNKLGFQVKKTMQIAQQLYEGLSLGDDTPVALITYMRTDSLRVADSALKQAREHIEEQFEKQYLPEKANMYAKKGKGKTQDAHEAIRPVDCTIAPSFVAKYASADHAKLYDLIWKRFIASQMENAEYAQRQVIIKGKKLTFKATGSTLLFDGFLKVYQQEESETVDETETALPLTLEADMPLALDKVVPKQHFTQPPPRYNEASLVKELEKEGIGRPSTYATIMNTIRARAYTTLEKKRFIPTELGMAVTEMLVENLPKIMDRKFTANMELDLDKIARGEINRDVLLKEFYATFQEDLDKFRGSKKESKKKIVETELTCPQCKKNPLVIRFGKAGEFLGCKGFPECTFTSNFVRDEAGKIALVETKQARLLEEKCPECGKQLREIPTKTGSFVACSGYPACKYVRVTKAPFPCPLCKSAVVQRKWQRGLFWGCSSYPNCKFAVFGEIVNQPCPSCKWPFLTKKTLKSGTKLACANKECGYTKDEVTAEA
jgi:DNA topoisomerase-1